LPICLPAIEVPVYGIQYVGMGAARRSKKEFAGLEQNGRSDKIPLLGYGIAEKVVHRYCIGASLDNSHKATCWRVDGYPLHRQVKVVGQLLQVFFLDGAFEHSDTLAIQLQQAGEVVVPAFVQL